MLYESRSALLVAAIGACAGVAGLAMSPAASASEIGIQFSGAGTPLPSTQAAGVVSQTNWNAESASSNGAGATGLVDSTGATVAGFAVAWSLPQSGTISGGGGHGSTDVGFNDLYSSHLESPYGVTIPSSSSSYGVPANRVQVYLTGIPYATYDIYVYTRNNGNSGNDIETPNISSWNSSNADAGGNNTAATVNLSSGSYTSISFTDAGASSYIAGDNYVVFTGLTGATQYLLNNADNNGFAGIQIVDTSSIPEPGTLALLTLTAGAGLLLLGRKRLAE